MENDPRTQPLIEWNRLARENAENAIVSSMFEATTQAAGSMESFSNWLLVTSAAIGTFMLSNVDKLLPFLKQPGFSICGAILCLSAVWGLFAKVFALQSKISSEVRPVVLKTFNEQLALYEQTEQKIQEGAKFWGITLQSGIRMDRILTEYLKPMPWWVRWLATRGLKKHADNPQLAYLIQIKRFNALGFSVFIQFICLLVSIFTAFMFIAK
jgi:hypothetical protein